MHVLDLDYNSTTPLLLEAFEAMRPFLTEFPGNPSSMHSLGRKARQALEGAREKTAQLLGADPDEVIFTSGATEANNLAIQGLCGEPPGRLRSSPIEHPCVVEPLKELGRRGFTIEWLPVSVDGTILAEVVTARCHLDVRLIAIMLANNETGAIQPVREMMAGLPSKVAFHCDAAHAVGKMPVNFHDLGVTTLSASAHKFYGPPGIGILLVKKGTPLSPRMFGGHQQGGRRPGTESAALAVGLAVALEHAVERIASNRAHLEHLRSTLWEGLREAVSPVVLNGPAIGSPLALPGTLNVSFPGCRADVLLMSLDLVGVACSTGSACSSGSLLPSPVLAAMGVPEDVLRVGDTIQLRVDAHDRGHYGSNSQNC